MKNIVKKLKSVKHSRFGKYAVRSAFGDIEYELVPLTIDRLHDNRIIRLLSNWRKKHEFWFPSQFPVTHKRTKVWLGDRVINEPDRILCMIRVGKEYIGHLGFYRFDQDKKIIEIDNVIRGVDLFPGIMSHAMMTLMDWGRKTLGLVSYNLEVASDNARAVRFYERIGFREFKRVPLIKKRQGHVTLWTDAPLGYKKPIKRYNVFMKLQKKGGQSA